MRTVNVSLSRTTCSTTSLPAGRRPTPCATARRGWRSDRRAPPGCGRPGAARLCSRAPSRPARRRRSRPRPRRHRGRATGGRPVRPAIGQHVVEDRRQQLDRHDHVDVAAQFAAVRVLHMQRADADQPAVGADQRGAAPERMRRRGKDRAVEHVFPISGEFLPGDDRRRDRVAAAAFGGHDGAVAGADPQPDRRARSAARRAARAPARDRSRSPGRSRGHAPARRRRPAEVSQIVSASVIR